MATNGSTDIDFVISRTFAVPCERVWAAWTSRELLGRWWGPKGFGLRLLTFDLRPGGVFHYAMRPPQGPEMWGRFTFREIVAPERLVFTSGFADRDGAVTPNPWMAGWPLETLTTVTFAAEGEQTLLTLRGTPFGATPAENALFAANRPSMQAGFGGTFDQLAAALHES